MTTHPQHDLHAPCCPSGVRRAGRVAHLTGGDMIERRERRHAQLVGELLAEALRNANPAAPTRTNARRNAQPGRTAASGPGAGPDPAAPRARRPRRRRGPKPPEDDAAAAAEFDAAVERFVEALMREWERLGWQDRLDAWLKKHGRPERTGGGG
jgi:hypothetical protein